MATITNFTKSPKNSQRKTVKISEFLQLTIGQGGTIMGFELQMMREDGLDASLMLGNAELNTLGRTIQLGLELYGDRDKR